MDRGWYARFTLLVAMIVVALGALWPSVDQWVGAPDFIYSIFEKRISPGLDIKGGLRLEYDVLVDKAIEHRRDRSLIGLLEELGEEMGIDDLDASDNAEREAAQEELNRRVTAVSVGNRRMRLTFADAEDASKLSHSLLQESFPSLREIERDGNVVTLGLRDDRIQQIRDDAVEQTKVTIGNRIDEMQIVNANVESREETVIIEVPGATEAEFERIRDIVSRTARLEFRIVDDAGSTAAISALEVPPSLDVEIEQNDRLQTVSVAIARGTESTQAGEGRTVTSTYLYARGPGSQIAMQRLVESFEGQLPDGRSLSIARLQPGEGGDSDDDAQAQEGWRTYFLHTEARVTGDDVDDAFVTFDQNEGGRPVVIVNFGGDGADRFEDLTGANVKKRMAIVLDNRVESAPVIQARIGGGRCQITLGFGNHQQILDEANSLVIVLKAGALPAPIEPRSEQHIGPTLGQDSVVRAAEGGLIGVLLVLIFMALYYQVAGLVADLMVVLNVLFLLAILGGLGATLTLPGLAGIALTVGMAVDANVLITERIREELRLGKSPRSAVDQGFGRAFWSVMDAQITTFIAGVVLYQFGTGPIKGFAVTLMIGIVTSLFTGIFCSKVLLDWIVRGLRVQRLRVG